MLPVSRQAWPRGERASVFVSPQREQADLAEPGAVQVGVVLPVSFQLWPSGLPENTVSPSPCTEQEFRIWRGDVQVAEDTVTEPIVPESAVRRGRVDVL